MSPEVNMRDTEPQGVVNLLIINGDDTAIIQTWANIDPAYARALTEKLRADLGEPDDQNIIPVTGLGKEGVEVKAYIHVTGDET